MNSFKKLTAGKFDPFLGILRCISRRYQQKDIEVDIALGEVYLYEGLKFKVDTPNSFFQQIVKASNRQISSQILGRDDVRVFVRTPGSQAVVYNVLHDLVTNDLADGTKQVSNEENVCLPECWDLGRQAYIADNSAPVTDYIRTFGNYIFLDQGNTIHGPFLPTCEMVEITPVAGADKRVMRVGVVKPQSKKEVKKDVFTSALISKRLVSKYYVEYDGVVKNVTFGQTCRMKVDERMYYLSCKTFAGFVVLDAILAGVRNNSVDKLLANERVSSAFANLTSGFIKHSGGNDGTDSIIVSADKIDDENVVSVSALEALFDAVIADNSDSPFIGKFKMLKIINNELVLSIENVVYDIYTSNADITMYNHSCAVHSAAAAVLTSNADVLANLGALYGVFVAYMAICMTPEAIKVSGTDKSGGANLSVETVGAKGFRSRSFFTDDLNSKTSSYFRIIRHDVESAKANVSSTGVFKCKDRSHYMFGQRVTSDSFICIYDPMGDQAIGSEVQGTLTGIWSADVAIFDGDVMYTGNGENYLASNVNILMRLV